MQSLIAPAVFGLSGAALGFLTPAAAQKIARYKCLRKNLKLEPDARYTSYPVRFMALAINAAAWALAGMKMNMPAAFLLALLFSLSVLIAVIDLRISLIPNELVLLMLLTGSAFQILQFGFRAFPFSVFCMLAMTVLFTSVACAVGFGKVGAGDVKLAGAMGLALGYPNIITALLIMSAALFIYGITGIVTKRLTLRSMFPFAPFMMTGTVTTLIMLVFS